MTDMLALLLFGLSWILIRQIKQIESVNQPVSCLDFCYGNIVNETIFRQFTRPESTSFVLAKYTQLFNKNSVCYPELSSTSQIYSAEANLVINTTAHGSKVLL